MPYPSTSAANAIALAGDFSFSFLPARDVGWVLCDVRDGRVLLDSPHDNTPGISFFTETVVCDPLHRRYLLLPPIPDNLVAMVEDADLIKHWRLYETFLLPPCSGNDDEEDTSFIVIWMAMCKTKLVSFLFDSSTEQWRAGPSQHWSNLFPDMLLLWKGFALFSCRQFANGCFYWLIYGTDKILILDTRKMQFSIADAPPGTGTIGDIAIVEEGEETSVMFVRANDTTFLKYTAKRNSGGGYSQWEKVKRFSLDPLHFFIGSIGRQPLLYKYDTLKSRDAGCFSLDIETFQLERLCASRPRGSNNHIYSNFPLSLLPTPTVSSGNFLASMLSPFYHCYDTTCLLLVVHSFDF